MSEEGVNWLREASGLSARPGARRVYVRRNAQGTRMRPGGGLSESEGFQALLRDYSFETIDFGNGDRNVAEQVAMLEGAGFILAAHGAALTNLAYLGAGVKVIEIIGSTTESACFMHLADIVGLTYHGISSTAYDERDDIVVDLDELRDAIGALA
jgi:capsular polysaccharide biosynthesis protein